MIYLEIKQAVSGLLLGDNSKAEEYLRTNKFYLQMAFRDISMRCIPHNLRCVWDETKTDVFRRDYSTIAEYYSEPVHYYVRKPIINIEDDAVVDICEELIQPLIYFMCSYLSNKKDKDYVKNAEVFLSYYNSNSIDISELV